VVRFQSGSCNQGFLPKTVGFQPIVLRLVRSVLFLLKTEGFQPIGWFGVCVCVFAENRRFSAYSTHAGSVCVCFFLCPAARSFLQNRSSSNLVHILDPRYPRKDFFCLSKFVAVVEIRVRIAGVQYKIAQIKSKMGAKSFLQEIMT
jgi:hypothetical protein